MPSVLLSPSPPRMAVIQLAGMPSSGLIVTCVAPCAHAGVVHNVIAAHAAEIASTNCLTVRRIFALLSERRWEPPVHANSTGVMPVESRERVRSAYSSARPPLAVAYFKSGATDR